MMPTGCEAIDSLLGGGLVPKRINQIYGSSGTGKTNLCIQALVSALEAGKEVVFIDTEGGFSEKRLNQLTRGKADEMLDRVHFYRVLDFSEQEKLIKKLGELDPHLVIIDSLTSQYRPELSEGDIREVNMKLSKQVNELSKVAREKEIPVLVTNQVYSDFNSDREEVRPVGGDVMKYASKVILQLKKNGRRREGILKKHLFREEGEKKSFEITHTGLENANDI